MKRFLIRFITFCLLTFLVIGTIIVISNKVGLRYYKNGESESNLPYLSKTKNVKYLVLGISHARNLSRNNHHAMFEDKLNGKMLNLGQGDALGGLDNQHLYFAYFLEQGGQAEELIYIISPTLFYADVFDKNSTAFYREPIDFNFIKHLMNNNEIVSKGQIFHSIKSKLSHHWWNQKPLKTSENTASLSGIATSEIRKGFALAYPQGQDEKILNERLETFDRTINLAKSKGMKIKLIVPPALFGKWPGHDRLVSELSARYANMKILDHSSLVLEPRYYYDHHHLNSEGIGYWLEKLEEELK